MLSFKFWEDFFIFYFLFLSHTTIIRACFLHLCQFSALSLNKFRKKKRNFYFFLLLAAKLIYLVQFFFVFLCVMPLLSLITIAQILSWRRHKFNKRHYPWNRPKMKFLLDQTNDESNTVLHEIRNKTKIIKLEQQQQWT